MKKKILLALGLILALSACSGSGEKDSYKIGISQFAQHGSLDNCRQGFIEGLKEEGIEEGKNLEIDYQNADASTSTANQIAQNMVANKCDMIAAIATPSAVSSYTAILNSDIPLVYTAVTDPVEAKLANEDKTPLGNATGTSDILPVEAQLKTIREILPQAKNLGILYTTSEANSLSMIKQYQELAGKYGFNLVTKTVSQSSDIPLAADNLLSQVDVMTNLLDNTVVNSLPLILEKAKAQGVPVFGSEVEQVKIGCLAAEGLDYVDLGKQTGRMAAKILKGEKKASEMPYEIIEGSKLYINEKVAEEYGIELSDQIKDRAQESFDTIGE